MSARDESVTGLSASCRVESSHGKNFEDAVLPWQRKGEDESPPFYESSQESHIASNR